MVLLKVASGRKQRWKLRRILHVAPMTEQGDSKRPRSPSGEKDVLAPVTTAYADVDGYAIARDAKRQQRAAGVFRDGIQFGEVRPSAFVEALGWIAPNSGEHFVDLGSGTGIAVLTAAAKYRLGSAMGIEIQEPLHEAAVAALARCGPLATTDVTMVCGDALAHSWEKADLVFCSCACWTNGMVCKLASGAEKLRSGARVLVTVRALESPKLRLLRRELLPIAKGSLLFLAYERI